MAVREGWQSFSFRLKDISGGRTSPFISVQVREDSAPVKARVCIHVGEVFQRCIFTVCRSALSPAFSPPLAVVRSGLAGSMDIDDYR